MDMCCKGICMSLRDLCRGSVHEISLCGISIILQEMCTVNFYNLNCHFSLSQFLLKSIRVCALCVGADGTPVNMIICKSQTIYKH